MRNKVWIIVIAALIEVSRIQNDVYDRENGKAESRTLEERERGTRGSIIKRTDCTCEMQSRVE